MKGAKLIGGEGEEVKWGGWWQRGHGTVALKSSCWRGSPTPLETFSRCHLCDLRCSFLPFGMDCSFCSWIRKEKRIARPVSTQSFIQRKGNGTAVLKLLSSIVGTAPSTSWHEWCQCNVWDLCFSFLTWGDLALLKVGSDIFFIFFFSTKQTQTCRCIYDVLAHT